MIHPSCLPLPADQTLFHDGVMPMLVVAMLVALMVSALLSPLMRRRYRQKVTRLMGMNQVMPPRPETPTGVGEPFQPLRSTFDAAGLRNVAEQRAQRIRRATVVGCATFMGTAFVMLVMTGAPVSDGFGFMLMAALVAAGSAHCNWPTRHPWRARQVAWSAIALGLVLCEGFWPETRQEAKDTSAREAVMYGLAFGVTYFVSFHRTMRGQVLPIFCVALPTLLGGVALISTAELHLGTCWQALDAGQEDISAGTFQQLMAMLLGLLGTWLGLRALARLSNWLDQGWMSELSLISFYTLVIWAALLCTTLELHAAWTALLLVTWMGATVGAYALALGPKPHDGPAPQLLVLRVFSNDTRHHNLLDVVQGRWRLLGPVHQIGGPDMVAMNVDPHEAMKFLTNRLHELFLPTGIGLADLQARLATQPDKEGRFRINEVFCFNTAWQATVVQLMQLSDVILLDVRGFNAARGGTGFEIDQLATRGLLRRVLAVGNAQTNWLHVDELVRKAGQSPTLLQRVREDELVGDELFTKLCEVAGSDLGLSEGPGSSAAATGALA
jgi:hypothetical protein